MKHVIENINDYKSRSADKLYDEQVAYIPRLEPDQIECTVRSYHIDGNRKMIPAATQLCIRLKYIKYRPIPYRRKAEYMNAQHSMLGLVNNDIIQPFALFINGKCIPWGCMRISLCPEAAYITLMKEMVGEVLRNEIENIKYAQILTLPEYVGYAKTRNKPDGTIFSFDDEGKYSVDNPTFFFYIKEGTPNFYACALNTTMAVNALNVTDYFIDDNGIKIDTTGIKFSTDNVILFKNGLLAIGEKENIKKSFDADFKEGAYADYAPRLDIEQSDEELDPPETMRFDSVYLTINDAKNEYDDIYDIVVCANSNYTHTVDNISKTNGFYVQNIIQSTINNNKDAPGYFEELNTEFSMNMSRDKNYATNVANSIKTMLKYNSDSFKQAIKKHSNIEISEHSVEWIMANMDNDDGVLYVPRYHNNVTEEYIIMLVNGELYEYDHMIKYKANHCIIPIQGINYGDKIELIRFRNIKNTVTDLIVNLNDGFQYYSPDYINNDMVLFSKESSVSADFTYPADGLQCLEVPYSLETNEQGLIKIILEDEFYYGKKLKVAYKNRYAHGQYVIGENTSGDLQYSIDLSEVFLYCNDYSKYLVFYNGRKLDSSYYRLVLPVRTTTPFYEYKLYFSIEVKEGDRIDIIYAPTHLQDIVYSSLIENDGLIEVDKNILGYGISTDLYIVWLNGKKIAKSDIKDIDATRFQITSSEKSVHNLCITKYISDIDILVDDFKNQTSNWDDVFAQLTYDEIKQMLGISALGLTDSERDITSNASDIKAVMYELIREQYVSNPRVDITGEFTYGYADIDTTMLEEYDGDGRILFKVADAEHDENLENVTRNFASE